MVHLEEESVDVILGSTLGNFIRQHITKFSLAYVTLYTAVSLAVVIIGIKRGLRPWRALALVFSMLKIFVDLKKYIKEEQMRKRRNKTSTKEQQQDDGEVEFVVDNLLDSMEEVLSRLEMIEMNITDAAVDLDTLIERVERLEQK